MLSTTPHFGRQHVTVFECPVCRGVFARRDDGQLEFHALPSLSSNDVADLLQAVRIRVLRFLARAGVIDDARELAVVDADFAEREPALASLARASVSGPPPAGPEHRRASSATSATPASRPRSSLWLPRGDRRSFGGRPSGASSVSSTGRTVRWRCGSGRDRAHAGAELNPRGSVGAAVLSDAGLTRLLERPSEPETRSGPCGCAAKSNAAASRRPAQAILTPIVSSTRSDLSPPISATYPAMAGCPAIGDKSIHDWLVVGVRGVLRP
jgi:hypothetical protein